MTAFNRAWDLAKMPYHGTDEISSKKILQGGTRAFKDKRRTFRHDPARFWMTTNPIEAKRHAQRKAAKSGSPPVLLYITDEGIQTVPTKSWNAMGGDYITHRYPHRIDRKYISINEQGPKPSMEIPELEWEDNEAGYKKQKKDFALMSPEEIENRYDEWDWNRQIRRDKLREYREQLRDSGWGLEERGSNQ